MPEQSQELPNGPDTSLSKAETHAEIERLFRAEAGRLLAVLTRIFGPHNLELAEDTLQEAFGQALRHWQAHGIPDNPPAWIMQTARNRAIDTIRARKNRVKFSRDLDPLLESEWSLGSVVDQEFQDSNIRDDQLRMIFMCCHPGIKPQNRIPFILKTLCGLGIPAIASALLLPVDTVKKRLYRTRQQLRTHEFELPAVDDLAPAMDTVHTVLYLLFNEGFHGCDDRKAHNLMFCREAVGLVRLLIDEPRIVNQDTLGLLALMYFHLGRFESRVDAEGFDVPLDLQDRALWDAEMMARADAYLRLAADAPAGASGRFYVEACIAREHCRAASFDEVNWSAIVSLYGALVSVTDSPLAKLNQAIARAYAGDVEAAIRQVEQLELEGTLKGSHMPAAVLAHLNAKAGRAEQALEKAREARGKGGTPREQQLMMQQIERLLARYPVQG